MIIRKPLDKEQEEMLLEMPMLNLAPPKNEAERKAMADWMRNRFHDWKRSKGDPPKAGKIFPLFPDNKRQGDC